MKIAIIILTILVVLLLLFGVSALMAILLRLQEHDDKIEELRRDICNCQQGGQELSARINGIETNLKH